MTVPSRRASASNSLVEVSASGRRGRFTVEYKTRIVQEAAQCRAAGEIGQLAAPRRIVLVAPHDLAQAVPFGRTTGARATAWAETPCGHRDDGAAAAMDLSHATGTSCACATQAHRAAISPSADPFAVAGHHFATRATGRWTGHCSTSVTVDLTRSPEGASILVQIATTRSKAADPSGFAEAFTDLQNAERMSDGAQDPPRREQLAFRPATPRSWSGCARNSSGDSDAARIRQRGHSHC